MLKVQGYEPHGAIHGSHNSRIVRATQSGTGRAVVIKTLPDAFPSPDKVARFRREYTMTAAIVDPAVIETVALERCADGPAIVLEDFGGRSLREILEDRELTLAEALHVGARTAAALVAVHAGRLMHKDVGPGNVVWNPQSGQVKLIDFGISSELSRESPAMLNPNVLEGTLAYMSPEQTWRMNRAMDYRTDLYSLGATLYRLLAHRKPFESADPMELVIPGRWLASMGTCRSKRWPTSCSGVCGWPKARTRWLMFADLRGFTTLSEAMSVRANFEFLNRHMMTMEPIIEANGGFIDKYIGDGIMALFPRGPEGALRAAIAMQFALDGIHAPDGAVLRMGVGVHSGQVMVGTIGSPARMETTVIGNTVNLASRLEGLTQHYGARILVSGASWERVDPAAGLQTRRVGRVRVKGVQTPSDVYEVLDADPAPAREAKLAARDLFTAAMQAFNRRDLAAARAGFERALLRAPGDAVARLWLDRACQAREGGPDQTWTEVETIDRK